MITQPFAGLRPFKTTLDLRFLTREDGVSSDADIARVTGAAKIVGLHQEHGNKAFVVREPSSRLLRGDAIATDVPGLTLTIRFADCQGLALFDPTKRVVCLVHAGWRGVRAKVVTSALRLLGEEWEIDPTDLIVGIAPSLCRTCAEFTDPKTEAPELAAFTTDRHIDLQAAVDAELMSLGVNRNRIERLSGCTRCSPEKYFTYRGGDKDLVTKGYVNCLTATLQNHDS